MNSENQDSEARTGQIALKGFFRITAMWECTITEQRALLGGIEDKEYEFYLSCPAKALPPQVLQNISQIFGIYRALFTLYPSVNRMSSGLRLPRSDAPFEGEIPMEFMIRSAEHLALARRYFDAQCV